MSVENAENEVNMENGRDCRHFEILLVSSEDGDRVGLEKALHKSGARFEIFACDRAERALETISVEKRKFDLAVVDYNLPGMNGLTFFRRLKTLEDPPPAIMLTAHGSEYVAADAVKAGFYDYIVKDPEGWHLELLPMVIPEAIRLGRNSSDRGRMDKALLKAYDAMERRIEERARELTYANMELMVEIANRKKTQRALEKSEKQLRVLSRKLIEAQENERRAIAREIHDSVSSSLAAIKYGIHTKSGLLEKSFPGGKNALDDLLSMVQIAIDETRRIMTNLRPPILDDLGLVPTIEWWCGEFNEFYTGIKVVTKIEVAEEQVPEHLKIIVYRILQEGLNNAARHSGAGLATVRLFLRDGWLRFTLKDDGEGFDVEKTLHRIDPAGGLGLEGMKERAELYSGNFKIESSPGRGTTLRASWPI